MQVRLNHEWMGNKEGKIINIVDNYARILIERGTASEIGMPKKEEPMIKIQRRDKDKMIEGGLNK